MTAVAFAANEGPTTRAKALLAVATLLSVSGDVPLSVWTLGLGTQCILWVGSGVDIVHLAYVVGLVLYFFFLRSEYHRNMEDCIWKTVKRFQRNFSGPGTGGGFDFKKF